MRSLRGILLVAVATLVPVYVGGCSDEPVVDLGSLAGSGGVTGYAGQGGSGGSDAGLAGSGGSDAGQGGSDAGQAGGGGSDAGQAGSGGSDAGQAGSGGSDAGQAGSGGSDAGQAGSGGSAGSTGGGVFDCPVLGMGGAAGSDASAPDAASADASGDAATADASSDAGATVRVRVVTANITSDNYQAYEAPGIRIFQGLAPDIVMIQEFNYRHGTLRDLVDTAFGPNFCFFREPQSGGIPNGVVSRYPITGHGQWQDVNVPDRDFAWTRIDVPGPVDLWAVSVHLKNVQHQHPLRAGRRAGFVRPGAGAERRLSGHRG